MMTFFFTRATGHLRRPFAGRGFPIGRYDSFSFADGERGYRLRERVKDKQAAIVASILPAPESLFEMMALSHLVRENGAEEMILIIPYLGYARQDRPTRNGEGSIGVMVARAVLGMMPSRLIPVDLHSDLVRKAFGSTMTEISALSLFADALSKTSHDVIVAPDAGSVSRARQLARLLSPDTEVACIDKVRPRANVAVARRLRGDVRGKKVLVIDDMIDTGGTLTEAVKLVFQNGASKVRLAATHGIFSRNARERLSGLPIEKIFVTNTLPQVKHPKIRVLNIVPLILEKLQCPS